MEPITNVEMSGVRVPDKVMAAVQQALENMRAANVADLAIVEAGGREPDPAALNRVVRQMCKIVPKAKPGVIFRATTAWCAAQGWYGHPLRVERDDG
jgi:hypothetical protein